MWEPICCYSLIDHPAFFQLNLASLGPNRSQTSLNSVHSSAGNARLYYKGVACTTSSIFIQRLLKLHSLTESEYPGSGLEKVEVQPALSQYTSQQTYAGIEQPSKVPRWEFRIPGAHECSSITLSKHNSDSWGLSISSRPPEPKKSRARLLPPGAADLSRANSRTHMVAMLISDDLKDSDFNVTYHPPGLINYQ